MFVPLVIVSCISIHAPTNGATRTIFYNISTNGFQSTLRRTERPYISLSYLSCNIFQSTLRRTERLNNAVHMTDISDFNPRSDERSDCNFAQKNEKTIQNRLIILLFSTNSLRLLCSCIQYSFFLFIFHGANDLVILCSLSFRTTSKN